MSNVGNAIRNHHQALAERLAAEASAVSEHRSEADLTAFITFLKRDLLPHAHGEERHLYPVLNPVIREYGTPTATMSVDHEFIAAYAREIEETANSLRDAGTTEREVLERRLHTLVIQLDGLFQVHQAKEERIYLPLFEEHISAYAQQRLLDEMHEELGHTDSEDAAPAEPDGGKTLDVREIAPARRHPMIFGVFEALEPGTSFILINDHDPKPLYYQLNIEHAGQLAWEYLEQGPVTWRVRVGKVA
ncbi:MAG TPA: DUF2249 domain-containing protein [Ktedonobacterales bacterium]|jgi:uncharacterized protein (DUF2249 family)/hemerythrin-like domain-containing protein